MKKYFLALSLLFVSSLAFAAGGEHGDPHAIPAKTIFVQAVNLFLLLAILVWALRKKVSDHFAERARSYSDLVQRAEAARREAEKNRREISERLNNLKSTADASLKQAQSEAAQLKQKILSEAQALSQRLEEEAGYTARLEVERAKAELRADLLNHGLEAARQNLKEKVGASEQKKLQSEFVEKIQVVR